MAENPAVPAETPMEAPEKKKKPLPKLIIIIPLVIVVLGLQVLLARFMVSRIFFPQMTKVVPTEVRTANVPEKTSPKTESTAETSVTEEEAGELYKFEDIIINPAGTMGRKILSVSLSVELSNRKSLEEIKKKEPIVRDALITLLASKSFEYVADILNRETLRQELAEAANKHLKSGKVTKVYFTGFILQ
jgi:flagellar FliL protein